MNKKRYMIMIAYVERETPELYAVKDFTIDNDHKARAVITSDLKEALIFNDESITNALKIVKNGRKYIIEILTVWDSRRLKMKQEEIDSQCPHRNG